jgi:hypothetical protein
MKKRLPPLLVLCCSLIALLFSVENVKCSPYAEPNTNPPWYEPSPTNPPVLKVPEGSVNLASNKPVTCSDPEPIIGRIEEIRDGKKSEGWYSYLEIGPLDKQYVQIDLMTNATIYAIWIWHRYEYVPDVYVPNDVVVQITSDSTFSNTVYTVFNCDKDNTLGLGKGNNMPFGTSKFGKLITVNALTARFVRVYGRGEKSFPHSRFVEIEVYGLPAPSEKLANQSAHGTR